MNIERTIQIRQPPGALWPLLTETEHIRAWNPSVVSDEPTTPGPAGVGTRTRMKLREGSRIVDYETELTAFEPETVCELEMRGGKLGRAPMRVRYTLRPAAGGTELHYRATWRPRELTLRLMSPVIGIVARREARRSLGRLQRLAER